MKNKTGFSFKLVALSIAVMLAFAMPAAPNRAQAEGARADLGARVDEIKGICEEFALSAYEYLGGYYSYYNPYYEWDDMAVNDQNRGQRYVRVSTDEQLKTLAEAFEKRGFAQLAEAVRTAGQHENGELIYQFDDLPIKVFLTEIRYMQEPMLGLNFDYSLNYIPKGCEKLVSSMEARGLYLDSAILNGVCDYMCFMDPDGRYGGKGGDNDYQPKIHVYSVGGKIERFIAVSPESEGAVWAAAAELAGAKESVSPRGYRGGYIYQYGG